MRKFGLLVLLASGAVCASADNTVSLIVNTNDGQKQYEINAIDFIDFEEDVMKIHLDQTVENINIGDIEDMVFDVLSGIEDVRDYELADGLDVSVKGGVLAAFQEGKTITVRVFDMNGRLIDMASAETEINYSLADLAKGTYIVLVNDKAIKFIR